MTFWPYRRAFRLKLLVSQHLCIVELLQRCDNKLAAADSDERPRVLEEALDGIPGFVRQASRQAQSQRRSALLALEVNSHLVLASIAMKFVVNGNCFATILQSTTESVCVPPV